MNIYNISMKKSVFFKESSNIVATSISIKEGIVFFKTDLVTKKYLDDNKIPYKIEDDLKRRVGRKIFLNLNLILFFVIFLLILYINSFRVSNIKFNGEYEINDKIDEYVSKKYTHFLCFNFIDVDYEELSKNIRASFSEYEWIELYKEGSTINVVINNHLDENEPNDEVPGDIIAKKDGVISSFRVYQGTSKIYTNQYVKKGEVLISGTSDNETITEARGLVLGYTYEEIEISIPKSEEVLKETGNVNKYKLYSLFGKLFSFKKKTSFESYSTNKQLMFNFFNFFKIYKIEEIELYDIIKTYTFDEALNKAKEEINFDFEANKTIDEESIIKLELLYHTEDDDNYNFRFLSKKLESLGEFKKITE